MLKVASPNGLNSRRVKLEQSSIKTLGLQEHCIVFELSYMDTPHVLQVTPRKRVIHKILEIIYINKWLRFVSRISDSNG